jgi:hypothetical protein
MNGMFGLNGITGYLIAVVLLLSIAGFLGTNAVLTQQSAVNNPYAIKGNAVPNPKNIEDVAANLHELKYISKDNYKYAIENN